MNGLRKTTEDVLDVVEMVLAGTINKQIVRRIQSVGGSAIGLSGSDGGLIEAKPVTNHAEVGWVGDVTFVKSSILSGVLDMGYMPVVAPIGWIRPVSATTSMPIRRLEPLPPTWGSPDDRCH